MRLFVFLATALTVVPLKERAELARLRSPGTPTKHGGKMYGLPLLDAWRREIAEKTWRRTGSQSHKPRPAGSGCSCPPGPMVC